jgi:hypothetical protein
LFPERRCAVRLGGMNEKKRRLIDDDVGVSLINDFEAGEWSNGVMEEGMCPSSKANTRRSANRTLDSRA